MHRNEILEVYKAQMERFNKSREIQWKFNFSIWTLLALGIYYLNKQTIGEYANVIKAGAALLCVAHLLFCFLNQRDLVTTRSRARHALNALNQGRQEFIRLSTEDVSLEYWKNADTIWIAFQVMATVILAGVLFIRTSV